MREKKPLDGYEESDCHTRDVIGLTLQLQRFSVGTPSHIRHADGNTVLGHYDHLVINQVRRWLDFSPHMDWENSGNLNSPNSRDQLFSHYPIKLLFPSQEIVSKQPDFAYAKWKDTEALLADNPCMAVVLLNLTDDYRKQEGDQLLPNFLQLLRDNCQDQLKEMQCCVLPSLGYSDFCILMAGSSWKTALNLVEHLHGLTVADAADSNKEIIVLSTDYVLPVCHQSDKNNFPKYFDDLELMVRVNLCPGVTAQHLANRLPKVQVYRTSGGSDCFLSAQNKEGQREMMDFLLDNSSGSFVVDIVSTPHLLMIPREPALGLLKRCPPSRQYIDRFEEAITEYGQRMRQYNRHSRQINSLWELSSKIENICSQPHTGNLRQIIEDLLEGFSYCLKCCADRMDCGWDFANMEEHVGMFSVVVGNFLSDLSRSDCFFMERDRYIHASVSSATSLLIAYNQWVNRFTCAVNEITDNKNQSKHTFLVTTGGRDQTQTMDAFYFLDQKLGKNGQLYEEIPLVTQMSEMSLFDFSGTILRAAHECMHFSGIRRRPERMGYLLTFVIRRLSRVLADVLLSEEEVCGYALEVFQTLEAAPEVLEETKRAYRTHWKTLTEGIEQKLEKLINAPEPDLWNESQYLSKNVQGWMYNRLMKAFSGQTLRVNVATPYKFHMNEFAEALYKLTQAAQRDYYEECDQLCRKHCLPCVVFSYGAKTQTVFEQQEKIDETLDTTIQLILSRLLIGEPASSMFNEKGELDDTWALDFPFFWLITSNIEDILTTSVDIFKEAFADVAACEILEAHFADYVLMHVFEDWDLDSALEVDMANPYRIPAVLHLCYGHCLNGEGKLTDEARGNIDSAIMRLEGHGMPAHRLDSTELCNRLDSLLHRFNENKEVSEPLLTYLCQCKSDYEQDAVKAALKPFADSYQTIRLLNIDPEGPGCHEELLAMYNALIDKGRRLS